MDDHIEPAPVEPAPVEPAPALLASTGVPKRRGAGATLVAGALVAVLAGTILFLSGWTLGRQSAMTPGTPPSEAEAFQPFWDTYRAVTDRYAGKPVDRKVLIDGAIKGMISALGDPFSMYLTPEEYKQSLQGIAGEFSGIGATIGTVDAKGASNSCPTLGKDCQLAVVKPIPGSPADKAGLQPGDVITAIDGAALDGLTVDAALGKIRGAKDTAVRLTVVRVGDAPKVIEIIRAMIIQPEVETKTLADGKVGYIKLVGFSEHAATDFAAAVKTDMDAGRKLLVVDLRGNLGGFVTAARSIASQFLADGVVFWEQDAQGNRTQVDAQPGGSATDASISVVILVDGNTASASEIVAGALQDRGRALLIGTKTYGKGTVQQWTQLEGDSGGFRLTIARWLTPKTTWIHGTGIVPDVIVDTQPAKPGDDPVLAAGLAKLGIAP
jgi:carboxyl-terminal processing protease